MRLDLGQVVYVRAEDEDSRVGFGAVGRCGCRDGRAAAAHRAHSRGTTRDPPALERAVARFSRLGEHGGVWLAIGAAG